MQVGIVELVSPEKIFRDLKFLLGQYYSFFQLVVPADNELTRVTLRPFCLKPASATINSRYYENQKIMVVKI